MSERNTKKRHRSQIIELTLHATTLSIVIALCVLMPTGYAAASDNLIPHQGTDRASDQDISVILQLALKRTRRQLRDVRSVCDSNKDDAGRGNVASLVALANCFKSGFGRPKSLLSAQQLFVAAAGRGSAEAHLALGQFYADGRIVPRDLKRAADHFETAAQSGLPAGMIEYGLVLLRTKSDRRKACNLFERAAEAGARDGIRLLGDCHVQTIGGRSGGLHAAKFYRQAAELGDRTATLKLNGHVFKGVGADIARQEGCDWASEAASRYNQAASKALAYCLNAAR